MAFQPSESDVTLLLQMLETGLSGVNARGGTDQLQQYRDNPFFCQLLAGVFGAAQCPLPNPPQSFPWPSFRFIAGLTLKNNVEKAYAKLGEQALQTCARTSISVLQEGDLRLGNAACQIISHITAVAGVQWWSTSLQIDLANMLLHDMLQSSTLNHVQLGLSCLQYIMEDASRQIGETCANIIQAVANVAMTHPDVNIRKKALTVTLFPYEQGSDLDWLVANLSPMQVGLCSASFTAAQCASKLSSEDGSQSPSTMKTALIFMQYLIDYLDYIAGPTNDANMVHQIFQWWVTCAVQQITSQVDAETAAAGCDFIYFAGTAYLRCSGESTVCKIIELLQPHVPTLVKALFPCMVYKEEEVHACLADDDYHIRDANIHFSTLHRKHTVGSASSDANDGAETTREEVLATLRDSSSRCLDCLTKCVNHLVFPPMIEVIQSQWNSSDWKNQEVVILALGASAIGCYTELEKYLPELIPQLCERIESNDSHVLVKSVSLWTLHRFDHWVVDTAATQLLPRCIQTGLKSLFSQSKRIQWAAITLIKEFFAYAEDSASRSGQLLQPFLQDVVNTIHQCVSVYHTNNLALLCDLVSSIVRMLSDENTVDQLLQPFVQLMQSKAGEFTSTITVRYAQGQHTQLVHKDVFDISRAIAEGWATWPSSNHSQSALEMLNSWLSILTQVCQWDVHDDPDIVHYPLFLCHTLISAMDSQVLLSCYASLISAAMHCVNFTDGDIRATCCTIFYDVLKTAGQNTFGAAGPDTCVASLLQCMYAQDRDSCPVEATAVLSELCTVYGPRPSFQSAAQLMARQLRTDTFGSATMPSIALSVGSMLQFMPSMLDDRTLANVVQLCGTCPNTKQKRSATIGLCKALVSVSGPQSLVGVLEFFTKLVYSWQTEPSQDGELRQALQTALQFAAQHCSQQLMQCFSGLQESYRSQLCQLYGLQ